jgi:hypothetical protein
MVVTRTAHRRAPYRAQPFVSHRSLAFASALVCHCIFDEASAPPHASGMTWSLTKPGQAPFVSPVDGQGCVSWNSRLAGAERGCLAQFEAGKVTQTTSKKGMRRTALMDRRTLHLGSSTWRHLPGQ